MRSHMQYTKAEMYRLILAAQSNPGEKFNSERFWKRMIERYGSVYFSGRTAAGLRQKWRTLTNAYTVEELFQMNNTLEDHLNKGPIGEKELRRRRKVMRMIDSVDEYPCSEDESFVMSDDNTDLNLHVETRMQSEESETGSKMGDTEMSLGESTVGEVQTDVSPVLLKLGQLTHSSALSMPQILRLLHQVSGNLATLECYIKGEKVDLWTELEDIALKEGEKSGMYKYVLGYKGEAAVESRKNYLGFC
eukprot:TRINITY_DN5364_c0_g11_i1.p1 TRINITY_DN5364_c0_g11~~TRINITY_DN5364_c0_g11_i1.p1  ORF type:complete len:248 (+),score=70.61 TRINITY_DN5364_c0_g11_i1:262-1005(+)